MFVKLNCNPDSKNVGDCVIRALSKTLDQSWEETYLGICLQGYTMHDMPSSNSVWGAYLRSKGYARHILPMNYPVGYSVADFVLEHNDNCVLALDGHVVSACNGDYFDTWDSGDKPVLYYWSKE